MQIFGSEGILEITTGYLPSVKYLADPSWSPGQSGAKWETVTSAGLGKPEPLSDGKDHAGNRQAVLELLAAIRENRQPEGNIYDGRAAVEMIVAVFESQRLGKPVELPLTNRQNPLTMLVGKCLRRPRHGCRASNGTPGDNWHCELALASLFATARVGGRGVFGPVSRNAWMALALWAPVNC